MSKSLLIPLKNLLSICVFLLSIVFANGQKNISGTITDTETGEPLIGANVIVKGTTQGTVTDFFWKLHVAGK